jgi:hypothetical protein
MTTKQNYNYEISTIKSYSNFIKNKEEKKIIFKYILYADIQLEK